MREKSFGSQLCKNMKKHGVSSKGMSEMTGINESDILLWMNGKAMPSLEQASKLSDALGIPVHELTSYSPEVRFHGIDEYTEEEKQAMAEITGTIPRRSSVSCLQMLSGPKSSKASSSLS